MAGYCRKCGEKLWKSNDFPCDSCRSIPEKWPHSRFSKNEKVKTEFGVGIVVGIDLPLSRAWRWLVKIIEPAKRHILIEQGKTLAFFDKEIMLEYLPWPLRRLSVRFFLLVFYQFDKISLNFFCDFARLYLDFNASILKEVT